MIKRIISMGLCVLLVISIVTLFPITVSATYSGNCGDNLMWYLDDDGILYIYGTGEMTAVPWEEYKGLIKSVVIKSGVTSIVTYAFKDCNNLTNVEIADSVQIIGAAAFCECTSLTSINIPEGVTQIKVQTFYNCRSLTSIIIPNSVTEIGPSAFCKCVSLSSVIISNSVTILGSSSFRYCYSLQSIDLPDSVTIIGDYAFSQCSLTAINIPDSVTEIGQGSFRECPLKSVTIPKNVTSIGEDAFRSCTYLTSLSIDANLINIGDYAFLNMYSLETIKCPNSDKYHSSGNCLIETESKTLVLGCKNSIIPSDVSVTTIGNYAFYGCKYLKNINIPKNITKIGNSVFSGCSSLESITISEDLTEIGQYVFNDCRSLKFNEYKNVYYIGNEANPYHALIGPKSSDITLCEINDNTKVIAGVAFEGCSSLTTVMIPYNLITIGYGAFDGCTLLTDINIPDSTLSIGSYAFSRCESLTNVKIPSSVSSMGYGVFSSCSSLTNVKIPDSLTSIGDYTFNNCSSLIYFTIPNSVVYIGKSAFDNCINIEATYYYGSESNWQSINICEGNESLLKNVIFDAYCQLNGHEYDVFVTLPDCENTGFTKYICSKCGDSYITEEVEPLGHIFSIFAVTIDPTCLNQGYDVYECSRCGATENRNIVTAMGHNFEKGFCTVCGEPDPEYISYTPKAVVESLTAKSGENVTVSVTLENTPEIKSMAVSGVTFDLDNLALLGGEWKADGAVIANWNENTGKGVVTLSSAIDLNGKEVFTLTFHIDDEADEGFYAITITVNAKDKNNTTVNIATVSGGITVKNYIVGDVNDDGEVTDEDAIYLLFYTFFPEDYLVNQPCDFNGDGEVTDEDAIYILFYTFFPEDYPLC